MNPYSPSKADEKASGSKLGTFLGSVCVLIALLPTLTMTYVSFKTYFELASMQPVPQNVRPVGTMFLGFTLTAAGLLVATPLSLLCRYLSVLVSASRITNG